MKSIIIALAVSLSIISNAQNVTIDYQAWNPSNPPCNLFGIATNVPATGTVSGTIEHQTKLGQPQYNGSLLAVEMATIYESTSSQKGTRFRVNYDFKFGHTYQIYITLAANVYTLGYPTGPYLRIDVNNNGGGGNNACTGPQALSPNLSFAFQVSTTSFEERLFGPFVQGSNQTTLEISAMPATNGGSKIIRIKKIRIVETPPTPTFTLTGPTTIPCGTSVIKDFIVTNVYSSSGTLSYDWNLGSSNNGWIYNGSPAPQTFSTSTNTITLTSSSSASSVSSVAATVVLNNSNYTTLNSNTTVTNPLPDFNLTNTTFGFDCNSLTVTAPNLPSANFAITWYTNNGLLINGNASPYTTSNGNSVTITSPTNSGGTVYASIGTGACTKISTNQIEFCTCASWGGTTFLYGYLEPLCNEPLIVSINGYQDAVKYQWYINGTFLEETTDPYLFTYNWPNISYGSITVVAVTGCGRTNAVSVADFTPLCSSGYRTASTTIKPTIFPNPAANSVTVSLNNNSFSAKEKLDPKNTSGLTQILSIRIIDNTGNIRKTLLFAKGSQQVNFSIAELQKGIYFLEIFDGKKRQLLQLIKN
ncbi:MAG: T9SS C-terminal target domain-containing protein [Sphingobacteriia bacterium]|nr:MAG: T9SS C-terminal target domain-containing protein [Sphingobacteriia bacterium]